MTTYSTSISIGGVLPACLVPSLLDAAICDGTGLDWNGAALTHEDQLIDAIADMQADGEALRLYNDGASGGSLDRLERFCLENGLSYVRSHDPDHGDSGEISWWVPGMEAPSSTQGDGNGQPFIRVSDLVAILDRDGDEDIADTLSAIGSLVDRSRPPVIPSIEIVRNTTD